MTKLLARNPRARILHAALWSAGAAKPQPMHSKSFRVRRFRLSIKPHREHPRLVLRGRRQEQRILELASEQASLSKLAQAAKVSEKRVRSVLKKHDLLEPALQKHKRHIEEKPARYEEAMIKRYRSIVERLGYHPGARILRNEDGTLVNWILRRWTGMDAFRADIGAVNVVKSRGTPTPRSNQRMPFGKYEQHITKEQLRTAALGCASFNELRKLLGCSPVTLRRLLRRYGEIEDFQARVGTTSGKNRKGPEPTLDARANAQAIGEGLKQKASERLSKRRKRKRRQAQPEHKMRIDSAKASAVIEALVIQNEAKTLPQAEVVAVGAPNRISALTTGSAFARKGRS